MNKSTLMLLMHMLSSNKPIHHDGFVFQVGQQTWLNLVWFDLAETKNFLKIHLAYYHRVHITKITLLTQTTYQPVTLPTHLMKIKSVFKHANRQTYHPRVAPDTAIKIAPLAIQVNYIPLFKGRKVWNWTCFLEDHFVSTTRSGYCPLLFCFFKDPSCKLP